MPAIGFIGGDPQKLDLGGGTMTGPLLLSGDPTVELGAATKEYVDSSISDFVAPFNRSVVIPAGASEPPENTPPGTVVVRLSQ
jgi:hypothetical protein